MLKPKKEIHSKKKIKEDKFVTFYFQATEFLNQYKNYFLYGLIGIVAVTMLVAYVKNGNLQKEQDAAVELARGKSAFESSDFDNAISILGPLTSKFAGSDAAGIGCIFLGKSFIELSKLDDAEIYFRKYLDEYDDDVLLRLAAQSGLASCFDERGDYAQAAAAYEKAAAGEGAEFNAGSLLLAAARCYRLADDKGAAVRILQKITQDYSESAAVVDAKMQLAELDIK